MAAPRIRLNQQQADDFAAISRLDRAKLEEARQALDAVGRPLVTLSSLRDTFTSIVGEDSARALVRQLVAFGMGARREEFSAVAVDAVSEALAERKWSDEALARWLDVKELFWEIASHAQVKQVVKAFDLSFDYEHLFSDARIITDVRAVFDEDHSSLVGAIIRHVIRLSYRSANGPVTLSIAVDHKEIESIRASCEAALKKEAALGTFLAQPNAIESIIPGEERDELR